MKNLIIAALLFLFFVSLLYACNKDKEVKKLQSDREVIEKLVYAEAKVITGSISKYKDRYIVEETPRKEVKTIIDVSDTAALAIEILKKQIISLTEQTDIIKSEKKEALKRVDSLHRRVFFFKDEFLKLAVRHSVDSVDNGELIHFKYNADLIIDQYSKRKKPFAPKKYFIDIYSKDPRITINSVKKLSIEREVMPKFRIQSSMVYNLDFNTITPGIIGRFEIKRVSLSGSYMYSPVRDKWFTAIGFNYDLIRF